MEIDNSIISQSYNNSKSIQDYKRELDNIVYTLGSEATSYQDNTQARFIGMVKDINIDNKTITINDLSGDVSFTISKCHIKEICEDFDIFKPIVIHAKVRNFNGLLKLFVMKLLTIDEMRKGYQQ